jgi:hypothetical protein
MITALAMMFSIMTSYTRARAESLIEKCKVGFMERPERIVLFMIGAFTNRMAAVLWVILVLSVVTVANRIYYTYLELEQHPDAEATLGALGCSGATSSGATTAPPGLRPLGDRDPGLRLADPARLARATRRRAAWAWSACSGSSASRASKPAGRIRMPCACGRPSTPPRPGGITRPSSPCPGFRPPSPSSSCRADRIEALAQRLHEVHHLRRRAPPRRARHDLLARDLASMICRSPSGTRP